MTSLELAAFLEELAKLLRKIPDSELNFSSPRPSITGSSARTVKNRSALNGISLARMSKYTKSELARLIEENQIPIIVGSKDSAESVFKRLRGYLGENNNSKRKIRNQVAHGKTSPELTSALSYLLRDKYE